VTTAAASPLLQTGSRARVIHTFPPGHRRVPYYIRGKTGTIERYCGSFPNPEERAYGFKHGPDRHVYRVRFNQAEIWPDYRGRPDDALFIEIPEHWLLRAEEA
jgi:nitrile hydratase